jgi:hypothetical protein
MKATRMKKLLLLLLPLVWMEASAAPESEYFWFKNETQCAGAKVTVRSYCAATTPSEGTVVHVNSMCTEQQLLIERPGKENVRRDLLEHKRRDYLVAWSLTCAKSGDTPFLYVRLANGGNCDTCESDAVLDLSGRWIHDGRRWYATNAVRQAVRRHEDAWFKQDYVHLTNTVVDPDQE